jgi:predicted GNAT superfamily acetyltransferase
MSSAVAQAVVRPLDDMADVSRASELLAEIWGFPPEQSPVTPELLRALSHSGNYVVGAWVGDELVGVSAGFLGKRGDTVYLHSHIAGVAPDHQGGQLGFAIKQHQRTWALERDIATIEWTFDPLVRRNAYFNLAKLGAVVVAYERNFYGPMRDALNADDETDRALARWELNGSSRPTAGNGEAAAILRPDTDGRPIVNSSAAPVLRAWIPRDSLELRQRDPEVAAQWRMALRESAGAAIKHGYVAVDMDREGWYTLVVGGEDGDRR